MMKRVFVAALSISAACAMAFAQGSGAEQSIKVLMEQQRQAALREDAATYSKLPSDDYVGMNYFGAIVTKAYVLQETAVLQAVGVQAANTQRSTCDAMVGVWEYLQPSAPGLAVIAKVGPKYVGVFFNSLRAPDVPSTEPSTDAEKAAIYSKSAAGVWEHTCEGSAGKARLKLRWLYSLRPPPVGPEATLDWEQEGNEAKWWWLGTDGKRGAMGAGRLLK
jgi:hypothetical protein